MYTARTSRRGLSKVLRFLFVIFVLTLLVGGGLWLYQRQSKPATSAARYPQYLAFTGSYVFSVPKAYVLDDQSLPGVQLLYKGKISVKTLDDAYNANAIAVQPVPELADKKGEAFKKHINTTFVPELKKLSSDTKVVFGSQDGFDVARITVVKDGKPRRFIYIKNGRHPIEIVAKEETGSIITLEQTVADVEASGLKTEAEPLKQALGDIIKLIKDQKGAELYGQSAPEFKTKSSEVDLTNALQKATPYLQGALVVNGAAYKADPTSEFTAVFSASPTTEDAQPTSGVLYLVKINGKWMMKGLNLPSPVAAASVTPASATSAKQP